MAAFLEKAWDGYRILFDEYADERTKTWFLVAKPYEAGSLLSLYLMFVLIWGPKYMKGRPAYNLDKVLIIYNFMQVIACIYIFYYSLILAWGWNYKWICEPVDHSTDERAIDIAKTSYLYFIMKVVDLLDTVFFVLRKKYNQISFLHIYHHTGMVMLVWGAVTYLPGGHGTLIGVINTFVHIIMYSYYLYTVVNPSSKQSLWWKKYITQLQILQFFWCVVHMLVIVFKPDCEYPRWTSALFLPQNIFILALFIDFYIKNYIRKPNAQQIEDLQKKNSIKLNGHGLSNGSSENDNNELKILSLALNNMKSDTDADISSTNVSQDQQNRSQQNGTVISQNRTHSSHSHRSRGSNECNYSENRSRSNHLHIDEGKHGKSE